MSEKATRCSCVYCKKEYSSKGLFTHVDRSHLALKKYSAGHNGHYGILAARAKQEKDEKIIEYMLSPTVCKKCNDILEYDSRNNNFCSHSCSASVNNKLRSPVTEETKIKIANKIKKTRFTCLCNICKQEFKSIDPLKTYCTKKCKSNKRKEEMRAARPALTNYRTDCKFRFNLKDYPDEFNFLLIEQHGWYSASNRGNNLTGVSRDHMVSVRYGFDNNVNPDIISHPANCRLLSQSDNSSKCSKCSITLDELLVRIKEWDLKYS